MFWLMCILYIFTAGVCNKVMLLFQSIFLNGIIQNHTLGKIRLDKKKNLYSLISLEQYSTWTCRVFQVWDIWYRITLWEKWPPGPVWSNPWPGHQHPTNLGRCLNHRSESADCLGLTWLRQMHWLTFALLDSHLSKHEIRMVSRG